MWNRKTKLAVVGVACVAVIAAGVFTATAQDNQPGQATAQGGSAQGTPEITITVNASGRTIGGINSHYIGLSFESSTLDSGVYRNVGNLARMLKNLGSGVLRFGGISADEHFSGTRVRALNGLAQLAGAAGWSVLYTENLGTFDSVTAAKVTADAAKVSSVLGAKLAGVACGNEPDSYVADKIRHAGFTEADYLRQSAACLAAVRAGAHGVALAGPDTSGTRWLIAYAKKEAGKVAWLDKHYYALGCPGKVPLATLAAQLLSPAQAGKEVAMFAAADAAAAKAGAKLRISETNTAACGGVTGLSNSYASALWVVDYLLTGAEHGAYAMNFHGQLGGGCQRYTPLCEVGVNKYAATPVYYGMLFTHLFGTGHLLPVTISASAMPGGTAPGISAFALRPLAGGGLRLLVENMTGKPAETALRFGGQPSSATVLRLTGPSLLAKSGVRIQGAKIPVSGKFVPAKPSVVSCAAGSCAATIPPYSAAIVTVGG